MAVDEQHVKCGTIYEDEIILEGKPTENVSHDYITSLVFSTLDTIMGYPEKTVIASL
uniref:Uncharacterized protein n=1 Tax=Anguilla anguilla TaxID=7936 RepID=A0A0E9P9K9_ANGAN